MCLGDERDSPWGMCAANSKNPLMFVFNVLTMAIGNINDAPIRLNALVMENLRVSYPVLVGSLHTPLWPRGCLSGTCESPLDVMCHHVSCALSLLWWGERRSSCTR